MLSKETLSPIFWVFGMTRPGIEPRSPGPLMNTLTTWLKDNYYIAIFLTCFCVYRNSLKTTRDEYFSCQQLFCSNILTLWSIYRWHYTCLRQSLKGLTFDPVTVPPCWLCHQMIWSICPSLIRGLSFYFICLNFWDKACWFLSLRVFRLFSSSLLLFPQRFGRYVLRPSSSVCRTREPSQNFELCPLLKPRGSPVLILLAKTGYKC